MAPDAQTDPDKAPGRASPPKRRQEDDDLFGNEASLVAFPDDDEELPPAHARDRLLREFRTEMSGAVAGEHLASAIEEVLLAMPLDRTLAAIKVFEGGDRETVPAFEYLSAAIPTPVAGAPSPQLAPTIFSNEGRIAGRGKVTRVHLWGWRTSYPTLDGENVCVHKMPQAAGSFRYSFPVIRIDTSTGCHIDEFLLPNMD
ncbi:hypothetical protein [Amycolatopsis magusensis]|uniref:Uncharacterized protein n=1 Tax=Amycolatopsis magusensis TaxID=882444 RepID=A0ABS4PWE1_9PSEU|nr:hypothetical protein [Amycolatopsis magusensis]MBP2183737.1 hypothetical protein [Amycolatopsis magusensis]